MTAAAQAQKAAKDAEAAAHEPRGKR